MKKKEKITLFLILFLSFLLHFFYFHHPNEVVFDEVHNGKYIFSYLKGEHFFDLHPPLAKLSIAFLAKIFKITPNFDFEKIGEKYPSNFYLILRFLPNFLGTLFPLVIYLLGKELFHSQKIGLFCAFFCIFENSLLCQSRFILTDIFLLFFGFLGLYFYFLWKRKKRKLYLWLCGTFLAFSFSVKWTGLLFLGLCLFFEIKNLKKNLISIFLGFLILPFFLYFLIFSLHFFLLKNPGPGDAFFQNFWEKDLFQRFFETNYKMFWHHQHLEAGHPFSSKWYEWFFMRKPIFYWTTDNQRIYFLGNPFLWLGVLFSILFMGFEIFKKIFKKESLKKEKVLVFCGYFLNLLPFFLIKRVVFLYHYLPSLVFGILALGYLLKKFSKKSQLIILILTIFFFFLYSPLTYGFKISDNYFRLIFFKFWQ